MRASIIDKKDRNLNASLCKDFFVFLRHRKFERRMILIVSLVRHFSVRDNQIEHSSGGTEGLPPATPGKNALNARPDKECVHFL